MALQTSGQISLDDIHVEAGGTTLTEVSLNDSDVRGLIDKAAGAQNAINEYYGASAETDLSDSVTSQINGQDQLKQITVSNYISSGGTLRIPSTLWVWSDSTSVAAMIVDIPCTIINEGKIIGKGGRGGSSGQTSGGLRPAGNGGPAINVTSSGVTIQNSSGAFIAGGGGGGGPYQDAGDPGDSFSGGGGGAGGATGGEGRLNKYGGAGGVLNATGANGMGSSIIYGVGGGAGGSGGPSNSTGGGGGGRILPGVGGTQGSPNYAYLVAGGSAGNPGLGSNGRAGGGGGWGAYGANGGGFTGTYGNGGSGGAAITGTSRTLSNSGTIYGST